MESPNWPWHITERMRKMEIEMYHYQIRAKKAEEDLESVRPALAAYKQTCDWLDEAGERAAKAEAEVERLKKRPFGCKCETMREKMLGDGCDECNKQLAIEYLQDSNDELQETIDTLTNMAKDLLYIARTYDNKQNWNFIDKCWELVREIKPHQYTDDTDI